ncbi:hypothetical protein N8600_06895 [Gammaproteobacteria bacterium]|nr:hypothetical protein [Gammaproteobacteria bacterium]
MPRVLKKYLLLNLILMAFPLAAFAQDIPRTADGTPFLQGFWQAQTQDAYNLEDHVARHDMPAGLSVVAGGTIPYQPQALARRQNNFENRAELDPLNKCFLPGVPRIIAMPWPFQIFQTDEHVAMAFEWTQVFRIIYTAGQEHLYPGFEFWMGDSRAQWEGDTLVVTVSDLNDRTWLDGAGNFHSAAATITERYTLIDKNTIQYQATIDDPQVYTDPWTIEFPLVRQTEMNRLLEYQCQAEVEEANGDFERVDNLWYPAPIPPENIPFDADAGAQLPLPEAISAIKRHEDGTPDISGYYMSDAGGANYGLEVRENIALFPPSRGVVVDPADGVLPYQDWARAEQRERREAWRGYDDPTAHCFVAGIPRSHYVPSPFYILQPPGYVVIFHERMSYRVIPLDDRDHLPDSVRLWMGDAIGHWQGDTLVVESSNYNGKAWLNELGDVISHAQTVVETYTPVSESQIIYRATVADPIPYSRPWTIEMPFNQQQEELLEVACLEDNNDLGHLKDVRDEHRALMQQEN